MFYCWSGGQCGAVKKNPIYSFSFQLLENVWTWLSWLARVWQLLFTGNIKYIAFWFLVRFQMCRSHDNKQSAKKMKKEKRSKSGSWHRDVLMGMELVVWGWGQCRRGGYSPLWPPLGGGRGKQYSTDGQGIKKGFLINVILIILEFVT